MAPTYKVSYFPIKGLGESIRYLLSYGGAEFEDERVVKEDWPKLKEGKSWFNNFESCPITTLFLGMPFGQMPTLEVDGKKAHQSIAITRYLAKQFKLTGKDDWEDLEIDAVVDSISDLRSSKTVDIFRSEEFPKLFFFLEIGAFYYETDDSVKAKRKETLDKETLPYYLERLDTIAKTNGGHLAVGKVSTQAVVCALITVFFIFAVDLGRFVFRLLSGYV